MSNALMILLVVVFHWNLSNNKSPQISRTLLSILADHDTRCGLDVLHSSSNLQFPSLFQTYVDCSKGSIYYWYYSHFCVS